MAPNVVPQPSPRVAPLAEATTLEELLDADGFIKGSPAADEPDE